MCDEVENKLCSKKQMAINLIWLFVFIFCAWNFIIESSFGKKNLFGHERVFLINLTITKSDHHSCADHVSSQLNHQ